MKLRTNIEPDIETAELRYPEVLNKILNYSRHCDEHGDEDMSEYGRLEFNLHQITGKDISRYNLGEWWEEEGAEVLAFRISLPDPIKIQDLSKDEVREIVRRLKTFDEQQDNDESFSFQFLPYLDNYYHHFLKLNCKGYEIKLFQRNKDKSGKYFEYSEEEIIEKIWYDRTK